MESLHHFKKENLRFFILLFLVYGTVQIIYKTLLSLNKERSDILSKDLSCNNAKTNSIKLILFYSENVVFSCPNIVGCDLIYILVVQYSSIVLKFFIFKKFFLNFILCFCICLTQSTISLKFYK